MTKKLESPSTSATDMDNSSNSVVAYPMKNKSSRTRSVNNIYRPKSLAQEQAEEIQSSLSQRYPSFTKVMRQSQVSGGPWMKIPRNFCYSNLPREKVDLTLLVEDGDEFIVRFYPRMFALSGGWDHFATANMLIAGDVLVFQLVKATKFKVYIVRGNGSMDVDVALDPPEFPVPAKENDLDDVYIKDLMPIQLYTRKRVKSHPSAPILGDAQMCVLSLEPPPMDHNNEVVDDSEVLKGMKLSDSIVEFQDVGSFRSFRIAVNGLIIDSEITEYVRTKYYELCCSQKAFLHKHLAPRLNSKLVAGIISETVNISDAIRASTLDTPKDKFESWARGLDAFGKLGMNVGFLVSRLNKLIKLAFDSEQAFEYKRYRDIMSRKNHVVEEITSLEMKVLRLKNDSRRLEKDIKCLELDAQKHILTFRKEAASPW
ncbi:B3 domain-containing protein Os01g0234100-like isoform X2 [Papaver somniferum]|uniref:B3 domain-containing protein Os01g0234100-like isoform X2 n=1 Tax=Papaver somniferum TaxID=3469 RepID=UPI000E7027A0|nr:B3 domain-containing protein Os01g0234100-like isoform X2 [Papaver somniferum]